MGSSLRVALVSGEYPPASLGGTAAVCFDLSLNLSKRKVHTTVFCGKSKKLSIEKVNDYLDVVRMPIISPPPRHLWFPLQNLGPLLGYLKNFDIIHNVDPKTGGVLANFKRELRKPFITHVHGCTHCETNVFLGSPIPFWSAGEFVGSVLEYPLNEYLLNNSLRASDHVVVCSDARLEEMKRRNPGLDYSKVSVIYNGVDLSRERYVNADNQDVTEDDCSVLFWGRLFYNKGILQLLKAVSLVREDYPDINIDICGKGPLRSRIEALVHSLGLERNVHIYGYVSNEFLIAKIRRASVIALPSLYEGQPVAALEAMAHKKCLIMYDFPFAREYITDWENGLIAKGGDVEDLADRIRAAMSDRKLRSKLGLNAFNRVKSKHNWDILIEKYMNLYDSLT